MSRTCADFRLSLARGVRDLVHHIGLEEPDSRDSSRPLEPGMVMTIEPKIYILTATGHDNLSAGSPKKVADIERMMRR